MRLRFLTGWLVFITSVAAFGQSVNYSQDLSVALENHTVVLRHYYTDASLKFDSSGNPASKVSEGYGPTDGSVLVQRVQLMPDKLILTGRRLVDMFSLAEQKWQVTDMGRPVSIEVALPPGEAANTAVPRLLNTIFLKQSERVSQRCSPQEQQEFISEVVKRLKHMGTLDASKPPELPAAGTLDELRAYCLPGGERAYRVGRGIKPPHVKKAPDPSYSEAARQAKLQGTTVLSAIVTPTGSTSAISIERSLASGLDERLKPAAYQLDQRAVEAVSKWRFDPARFGNTPVPVVIDVEVNFKLY